MKTILINRVTIASQTILVDRNNKDKLLEVFLIVAVNHIRQIEI